MKLMMTKLDDTINIIIKDEEAIVGKLSYDHMGKVSFSGNLDITVLSLFYSLVEKISKSSAYVVIGVDYNTHASWLSGAYINEQDADDKAEELQDVADTFPLELETNDRASSQKITNYNRAEIEYFVVPCPLVIS